MRICPTNIIVPGGLEGGVENLWTPVLNFRSGTSGCQLNCTACGFICPTAAIRPITISEKLGLNEFAGKGPIRLGTAFVDRSRCLPWAMNTPCIVCQENCPVSPKAIYVKEDFHRVRDGTFQVKSIRNRTINIKGASMIPDKYATGDYFCRIMDNAMKIHSWRIIANSKDTITIEKSDTDFISIGQLMEIQVRLQQPHIDVEKCIGCGTCEHECPVSGKRAIRVTAENESRSKERSLMVRRK
jgi:ferredoxin